MFTQSASCSRGRLNLLFGVFKMESISVSSSVDGTVVPIYLKKRQPRDRVDFGHRILLNDVSPSKKKRRKAHVALSLSAEVARLMLLRSSTTIKCTRMEKVISFSDLAIVDH
jgi:hypothetical protein